jgi:hypothetical protein
MIAGDMMQRTLERLDEIDPGSTVANAVYYGGPGEVLAALNEGQRLFALITLGLQTVAAPLTIPPGTNFLHARTAFPDWILPLRINRLDGSRVRPVRIEELDALDAAWQVTMDTDVRRYASLGFDFLITYPQTSAQTTLLATYARQPVKMQGANDTPEIPEEHHPDLPDFATYRLRMKEGGDEFAKGLTYLKRFLDGARKYAAYVRAANINSRFDKQPFEMEHFDVSGLFKLRPDLIPSRRANG